MRNILCFLLFLNLYYVGSTQSQIGVKAGTGFTDIFFTNKNLENNYSQNAGLLAGIFYNISTVKGLSIKPSLEFAQKKFNNTIFTSTNEIYAKSSTVLNYINLPVHVLYSFPLKKDMELFIGPGLSASKGISGNEKWQTYLPQFESGNSKAGFGNNESWSSLVYGFDLSAGGQWGKWGLELNYNRSISKISNRKTEAGETMRSRSISIAATYSITNTR